MRKLRVSIVEFLNTAPLVWGFTDGPLEGRYDLSFTVPSLCADALRTGQADIAIIPAIEYQRMNGMVVLPEIAIAAQNEVRSLLVVSRKPIHFVKRLALDTNSRSTVALTKLLCRGHWGIEPEFIDSPPDPEGMLAKADAALLIGDPALRVRLKVDALTAKQPAGHGCCGGDESEHPVQGVDMLFVYDVVQQWREMTGKPSVLAVWAGRRDVVTPEVVADFLASRAYGLANIGDIAEGAALKLDLPPNPLERYLRESIDFHLHAENIAALEYYYERCAEAGLIPAARPIEFAAAPQSTPHAAGAKAE
jgi:chorismate dehydratase